MNIQESIAQLEQFRTQVHEFFTNRSDTLMDLLDALSSNTSARSVVELSLNPLFRREYPSLYDGIEHLFQATDAETASAERQEHDQQLMQLIARQLPKPEQRPYWLFGIDVTPAPRPFARTLPDRGLVYQPNTIAGNKPIAVGHQYSVLVAFPEKQSPTEPPWVVPLWARRVTTGETPNEVGAQQITALVQDETLPFHDELCVQVEDSTYSAVTFLGRVGKHDNLVTVVRLPGNRTVYRTPVLSAEEQNAPGHPTWYGEPFSLKDPTTWGEPDVVAHTTFTSRRGQVYQVHLEGWYDMRMRGKRNLPMHRYPFTLVQARVTDADGKAVFTRPLWLVVMGARRRELSLLEVWEAYGRRYDLEHFFRFGKQRLLMNAYQTPDDEHEENWWQIVQLAYVQLWLARFLVEALPRPWERYLPQAEAGVASPAAILRDFERIIRQVGTPAAAPKRRGKSPGRAAGTKLPPRERQPVVKKGAKAPKAA